ncbi:MAG: hypothetical protein HW403_759 [Dehalococcoidia bacterium]|nr:hypothetical protein [Dehalococcoidia bacterium]
MAKKLTLEQVQMEYDEDADVLYISFGEPEPADDADVTQEGVVIRTRGSKIVGLTVLNAAKRLEGLSLV